MRAVMAAVTAMVMAVMACGVGFEGDFTSTPPALSSLSPTLRIDNIALTPSKTTIISALEGVRLRDRPDASGPVDSITLAVMLPGETFQAESCQLIGVHWWAFGTYVSRETMQGWADAEFLSPNPCQ